MSRPLSHPLAGQSVFGPDFDIGEAIAPELLASRRADGWTAERQRAFCEAVATGQTIENAARAVGLSTASAYSFRNSAKGSAFAIGWMAAQLLQRQRLADVVAARAFCGQTVTVTRAGGETVERHFFDNRLAMAVLTRLDRLAAGQASPASTKGGAGAAPAAGAEAHAARLAAGEWDRYLDLLADNATPARAGLFLAARTADRATPGSPELAAIAALARADLYDRTRAGVPAEIDTADLDVAHRSDWTAEQWARAEAAGLLSVTAPAPESGQLENADGSSQHSQHSPPDMAGPEPVWWCDAADAWRTSFPPPADFYGDEEGRFGDDDYERELSDEEAEIVDISCSPLPGDYAEAAAARDGWFAALGGARFAPEDEEDEDEEAREESGHDDGAAPDAWSKRSPNARPRPDCRSETERAGPPAVETP